MISVIIVNYNGMHLLSECLAAVRLHVPDDSEIIVHDNGSSDGSVAFLRRYYPDVRLSISDQNLGFVGGNNVAARLAIGNHLLLLNSDTIVRSSLQPMVEILERDSSIWALGCRLVYGNGAQQESIGQRLGPIRLALSWSPLAQWLTFYRRTLPSNNPLYKEECVVCDWVSGACLMIPTKRWNELDGLDHRYFMYMEDVDFCERVHLAGGKICYTASSLVTHLEGAGRSWIGRRAVLNTARSYIIYIRKYYGFSGRLLLGIFLPLVWWFRSLLYGLLYLLGRDKYGVEKAAAYLRAGFIVMFDT